jgi:hypothetical protein
MNRCHSSKIHPNEENSMNERKTDLAVEAGTQSGVLLLPEPPEPSSGSEEEGRLLIAEAKEYLARALPGAKQGEPRAESKKPRLRNYTADRLFKEEPQRYRLISAMLTEGVGIRSIMRACKTDVRTIRSVERRDAQTVTTQKTKLIGTLGRVATMTAERLEEEIPKMNHQQLAISMGIATDKLQTLTGDPTLRIEHSINPGPNIFDRVANLHADLMKAVQAKVIEPTIPELTEQ